MPSSVDLAANYAESGVAQVLEQLDQELIGLVPVKTRIREIAALLLVVFQNIVYLLALHAVSWWVLPRLKQAIPEPPRLLRPLLALDPS